MGIYRHRSRVISIHPPNFLEYFTSFHLSENTVVLQPCLGFSLSGFPNESGTLSLNSRFSSSTNTPKEPQMRSCWNWRRLPKKGDGTDFRAWNLIHFACRCLNFIVPSSTIRKFVTTVCLDRYLKLGRLRSNQSNGYHLRGVRHFDEESTQMLGALLNVFSENHSTIVKVLEEWLVGQPSRSRSDIDASLAVEILAFLPYALRYRHYDDPKPELEVFWRKFTRAEFMRTAKVKLVNSQRKTRLSATSCSGARKSKSVILLACYGIEGAFLNIPYRIFPMMWSAAPQLLGSVLFAESYSHLPGKPIEYLNRDNEINSLRAWGICCFRLQRLG